MNNVLVQEVDLEDNSSTLDHSHISDDFNILDLSDEGKLALVLILLLFLIGYLLNHQKRDRRSSYTDKYSMDIHWSDDDDAYIVTVPELPGCRTHGSTYEEALRNGKDAIESWIDASRAWGDPIPLPLTQADRNVDRNTNRKQHEITNIDEQNINLTCMERTTRNV